MRSASDIQGNEVEEREANNDTTRPQSESQEREDDDGTL